jgi:hypothetical protein
VHREHTIATQVSLQASYAANALLGRIAPAPAQHAANVPTESIATEEQQHVIPGQRAIMDFTTLETTTQIQEHAKHAQTSKFWIFK